MARLSVLSLLAVVMLAGPTAGDFILVDVFKMTHAVVIELLHTWELVSSRRQGTDGIDPLPPVGLSERRLMSRMREISREVEKLDHKVQSSARSTLYFLASDLPSTIRYNIKMDAVFEDLSYIDRMDELYNDYLNTGLGAELLGNQEKDHRGGRTIHLEQHTLESFASAIVSYEPKSVRGVMDNLHRIMVTDYHTGRLLNRRGLFQELLNLTEAGTSLCNIQQSPQLLIYNLYTAIQLTQLKAYSMIQFSWMLLKFYGKGNFTLETKMMRETYLKRLSDQAVAVKDAMREAKKEMWRCDPRRYQEGETYTELTKLLQGYIVNEVDLVEEPSCRENCGYYQFTKQYNCYKDNYCSKQPACRGDIVECKFVDSDMWICPGATSSKRRYDWIEYENGRTLGERKSCTRAVTKVDSWWTWLVYHCSYCFCFCDDYTSTQSDRFFNLREVTSDVENNKVVTGIKFVKVKRVIHLQIQQGQLMPKAQINESTVNWKNVEAYDVRNPFYKEDRDYHKLTYSKRALDLDDLFAPKDYVVTGVKFRRVGSHLNFELKVSQFNFTTGELISKGGKSHWISNDNTDVSPVKPRRKLKLDTPDVPTRTDGPSKPDSESDMYLEFTYSDVDLDAGQSTVPFIDTQEVAPSPPVPLSGVGIYHKGKRWFGGFVAPKVFTYDYVDSIQDNYSDIKPL